MTEDFYIQLIYKNLSGEITPSEVEQLSAWLREAEENQLTETAIRTAWEHTAPVESTPPVDITAEFQLLEDRIEEEEKEETKLVTLPDSKSQNFLSPKFLAAASILLLAAFTAFFFLQPSSSVPEWVEIQTGKAIQSIQLADNSKVYLNTNTTLSYPTTFSQDTRRIKLSGEAYFEVTHDAQKPFIVETPFEEVTVLGTAFNVKTDGGKQSTSVYVTSGKVQLKGKESPEKVILVAQEKGIYARSEKQLSKLSNVSPNEIVWQTQELKFTGEPLAEVLTSLKKWYDLDINITQQELLTCPLTISFGDETEEEIVELLATLLTAEFIKQKDKSYQLNNGRCE